MMLTSLSEGLMAEEQIWTKPQSGFTQAGPISGAAAFEAGMNLDEGFNWGRIRRLAKKG